MRKTILLMMVALWALGTGSAHGMSGGQPVTDPAAAPWVATLAKRGDGPLIQRAGCGGALITPDRVLTAAHCVDGADLAASEVHVNARVLSGGPGVVRGVRGAAILPGYEILPSPADPANPNWSSARRDLAVLLLDRPVTGIAPVRIAGRRPGPGTPLALYSHGTTGRPGEFRNDVLHRGVLTALDRDTCRAATPAVVDDQSVGCGHGHAAACYLDSGSPLIADGALVGVFSFAGETAGKECRPFPMFFADASAFRWWAYLAPPDR